MSAQSQSRPPSRTSVEVVDEYLRCMREGDRAGLREVLSGRAEIRYFGPHGALPWVGVFRGVRGLGEFAARVMQHLEVLEAAEIERICEDALVVLIARGRWRVRASGKELRARTVSVFEVESGQIVRYHIHTDTAAFTAAMAAGGTLPGEPSPGERQR